MLSPTVLELKQFSRVTSGTSSGSANVISAHYHGISTPSPTHYVPRITYIIKRRPMLRRLNNLNRSIVPHTRRIIRRQRHLRQTKSAIILHIRGSYDGEDGQHRVAVVQWLVAVAHVEVELGEGVAGEPAGLDGDGAAFDGPFCAVGGGGYAAACGRRC